MGRISNVTSPFDRGVADAITTPSSAKGCGSVKVTNFDKGSRPTDVSAWANHYFNERAHSIEDHGRKM